MTELRGKVVLIAAFRETRKDAPPESAPGPRALQENRPEAERLLSARSIEHRWRMLGFLRSVRRSATLTG